MISEYKAEIYRKKKTAILENKFGTKIGSKDSVSFQVDQVVDGFGDGRKFQFFFDGRIVSLVKFSKQDRGFDNKINLDFKRKVGDKKILYIYSPSRPEI